MRLLLLSSARLPLMQAHRRMMLPVHSLVCLAVFGLSLPLAISLFPQMSEVLQQHLHHFPYFSTANNCCSGFNFVWRLLAINLFMCVCVFWIINILAGNCLLIILCSSQIEASHLEPEIAMATDCKVLTYNKGLWWKTEKFNQLSKIAKDVWHNRCKQYWGGKGILSNSNQLTLSFTAEPFISFIETVDKVIITVFTILLTTMTGRKQGLILHDFIY